MKQDSDNVEFEQKRATMKLWVSDSIVSTVAPFLITIKRTARFETIRNVRFGLRF